MPKAVRHAIAPVYLLLCLVLGGSVQGVWSNALLQALGLVMIGWAAASTSERPLSPAARRLLWILIVALAWIALQQIPLPGSLWASLGGRQKLAHDFAILGTPAPAMSLSLAPYSTIATLLRLIPAIAIFCVMVRLHAYRSVWLIWALLGGTLAGILLGALQVANGATNAWYPYAESNFGVATGFFANANHMATLLVICIPFLAALVASTKRRHAQRYPAIATLSLGVALLLVAGLIINRSFAGIALGLPALALSSLLVVPRHRLPRRWVVLASAILAVAAIVALAWSPIGERSLSGSVSSRAEMSRVTSRAAADFVPFGSGLGTFQQVYQLYEDHDRITTTHVNHAHNDYLELVLETGVPGALLIVAFLLWWLVTAAGIWRNPLATDFARAGTIASAAVLLHSLVDFPLRTASISVCFAASLALMVAVRRKSKRDASEIRPSRHLVIG
jgi:hypothetical protein